MPEPTTIRELEDWHARRAGWRTDPLRDLFPDRWYHPGKTGYCDDCGLKPCGCRFRHPIGKTIDAAVLAMPEGWTWTRTEDSLDARHPLHHVSVPLSGHTPEAIRRDLLALARLAWIAEGATPRPATIKHSGGVTRPCPTSRWP